MAEPGSAAGESAGIVQSLRRLAATLVAVLQTRVELLVTELEEERIRILQLLFWAAGALFFFGVGVLLLTVFIVALFWESNRLTAIVVLAGFFFLAGLGMAYGVRSRLHARSRLFATSLDELARDKDRLTPR